MQPQPTAGLGKGPGAICTVVSHDALNLHTVIAEEAQSVDQEARGGVGQLIGVDLHVGQTAGVIHAHMQEVPASRVAALLTIAGDPMSQTTESTEFFGIDVYQLAGRSRS